MSFNTELYQNFVILKWVSNRNDNKLGKYDITKFIKKNTEFWDFWRVYMKFSLIVKCYF